MALPHGLSRDRFDTLLRSEGPDFSGSREHLLASRADSLWLSAQLRARAAAWCRTVVHRRRRWRSRRVDGSRRYAPRAALRTAANWT